MCVCVCGGGGGVINQARNGLFIYSAASPADITPEMGPNVCLDEGAALVALITCQDHEAIKAARITFRVDPVWTASSQKTISTTLLTVSVLFWLPQIRRRGVGV